jgi:aryl-alcohol dehydrogenase-like predicted oxidoreductase
MVSAVGLGGMALSVVGRPPESAAIRVIHAALDSSVNLIDTADVYCLDDGEIGHNERLIRKALGSWNGSRHDVIVATKGGFTRPGGRLVPQGHPTHLKQACERSLRALGTDAIDLYQLHTPDPAVPFADSVGAISELRDQGKVRWVGLSNVGISGIKEAQRIVRIQTVQNQLSLLEQGPARGGPIALLERAGLRRTYRLRRLLGEPRYSGVLQHCERQGLGFLAYSPLGGRRTKELGASPGLGPIAQRHGVSPHLIALAWTLALSTSVIPIPSARTQAHILECVGALAFSLTTEELAEIGSLGLILADPGPPEGP